MKLPRRKILNLAVGAAVLLTSLVLIVITGEQAWSQTARTIKIIVPYAPGGGGAYWRACSPISSSEHQT